MTEEEKIAQKEKDSNRIKRMWEDLKQDPIKLKQRSTKISETRTLNQKPISEEAKKKYSMGTKKVWKGRSKEEKQIYHLRMLEGRRKKRQLKNID